MDRIIINARAHVDAETALQYVAAVVRMGRISAAGESYCHATTFRGGVTVYARRNVASDTFYVHRDEGAPVGPNPDAEQPPV